MWCQRSLVVVLFSFAACASPPPGLEVLIVPPHGAAPDAIEVRVYNRFQKVAMTRIAKPALPGAVRLTSAASAGDQLRVVVLGLDAKDQVQMLDGGLVTSTAAATPLTLHLSATYADGDHDRVPDALDDCPTVPDAEQQDARGFGNPGDACANGDLGPGDAAAADLGVLPDLASGPNLSPGDCPNGAVCDDFEEPQVNSTRWMVSQTQGAVVEIDTHHAFSGHSSLHVHMPALTAGTLAFATLKEQATFPSTDIHVRAYILVQPSFGPDAAAFMLVEQAVSPNAGIGLQLDSGGFSMFNGLHQHSVAAAGAIQSDVWTCVEWEVIIDSAGTALLWLDGRGQNSPLLTGDTTSVPAVGELALGLVDNATTAVAARDLWIDKVEISGQPIGCQ